MNGLYTKLMRFWPRNTAEMTIPTTKGDAHVIVSGEVGAEPLVLLHGMNATSAMWYPNAKALSKKYRVYAIDFINETNKSTPKEKLKSINSIVAWYIEVFDRLNLDKVKLVGASKGGWIASHIAMKHPERIEKMVLLSPAQTFVWIPPSVGLVENLVFEIAPKGKTAHQALSSLSSNTNNIEKEFKSLFYYSSVSNEIDATILKMQPYSDRELQRLVVPTLVLIGDRDIVNNQKTVVKVNNLLPNGSSKIIPHAGHFLSIDQARVVNKEILVYMQ